MSPSRSIYVNLAVRDLTRSIEFFTKLGFGFDARFTDGKAACMIVSEQAFVMLLAEPFFGTFTRKALCDTSRSTEVLCAISCGSRAEVDELVNTAIAAGGKQAMEPMDHGFMYQRTFYDLDEHHWEVIWMDPAAVPPQ
jgi:uncharacterized protein